MSATAESRLQEHGLTLPAAAAPAGNYVPYVITGNLLFISGQMPFGPGGLEYAGKVGADLSIEQGQAAARLCGLNILAQAKAALGDLERITRCVKLGGFVNCPEDFTQQPQVLNGASDLMALALAEKGAHARFATGASNLPAGAAVEIDAVFEFA